MMTFNDTYLTYEASRFRLGREALCFVRGGDSIAVQHIEEVVDRLLEDRAFRMKYSQDPDTTLQAYLSPDEIHAIKTGDGHRLLEMGCGHKLEDLTEALCGPHPGP